MMTSEEELRAVEELVREAKGKASAEQAAALQRFAARLDMTVEQAKSEFNRVMESQGK